MMYDISFSGLYQWREQHDKECDDAGHDLQCVFHNVSILQGESQFEANEAWH